LSSKELFVLRRQFQIFQIFVLFLCGVQLVLKSGVLTVVLDLDEVLALTLAQIMVVQEGLA
jgi:hypothetical protein